MGQSFEINYYNRKKEINEVEKVYGDSMIKLAYNTVFGKIFAPAISSRWLSQFYGYLQDKDSSRKKVPPFLKDFNIDTDLYNKGSIKDATFENSYKSFNEFFIRTFKDGKRKFVENNNQMGAFAEARYFGHEAISDELKVPVKGSMIKAIDLIGNEELAKDFIGGPFIIARLCPVDYHRYHYPDDGHNLKSYQIKGQFHSVNPLALKYRQDILIKNERRVSILETENFGKLAYIEVGATCVGKIVQSFDESKPFKKGDEKGYFLFGGSTVIVCGEPGKWKPSSDIIANTKLGVETYIELGDEVGVSIS